MCDITSHSPCPCWQVFDELEEIGKTIQEDVLDAGMPVHGSMGGDISKCPYYATKMGAHFILFSENMQMNQFIHILATDKDKSPSFISFDFSTFKEVCVLKHTSTSSLSNLCLYFSKTSESALCFSSGIGRNSLCLSAGDGRPQTPNRTGPVCHVVCCSGWISRLVPDVIDHIRLPCCCKGVAVR